MCEDLVSALKKHIATRPQITDTRTMYVVLFAVSIVVNRLKEPLQKRFEPEYKTKEDTTREWFEEENHYREDIFRHYLKDIGEDIFYTIMSDIPVIYTSYNQRFCLDLKFPSFFLKKMNVYHYFNIDILYVLLRDYCAEMRTTLLSKVEDTSKLSDILALNLLRYINSSMSDADVTYFWDIIYKMICNFSDIHFFYARKDV